MSVLAERKLTKGTAFLLVHLVAAGMLQAQTEKHGWPEETPQGPVKTMTATEISPEGEVLYRDIKEYGRDGRLQKTAFYGYRGEFRGFSEETYGNKGMRVSTRTVFPEYSRELITKYRVDGKGNITESVQYFLEGDVAARFQWEWFSAGYLKSVKVFTPEGEIFFSLEYTESRPGIREGFTFNSATSGAGKQKLSYNSLGRLEAEPFFNADGGLYLLKYTYDDRGMVVREDVINTQGEQDSWIVYKRDQRGNVVESRRFLPGDYLVQIRKVELEYWP